MMLQPLHIYLPSICSKMKNRGNLFPTFISPASNLIARNCYKTHFKILPRILNSVNPSTRVKHFNSYSNRCIFTLSHRSKMHPYITSFNEFNYFNHPNQNPQLHTSSFDYETNITSRIYPPAISLKHLKTKTGKELQSGSVIEKENIFTIPNLLCLSRIVAAPIISYCIITNNYDQALWLFIGAGVTDLLDGWIARNFAGQSSKFGSFFDPLADKILVAPVFFSLAYSGLIPVILTVMIIYRDVAIIAAASWVRYTSIPYPKTLRRYFDATYATVQLAPTTISKLNTVMQLALVTACLTDVSLHLFESAAPMTAMWIITGVTTFSSGISYIFSNGTYKFLSEKKI